jgi:hypothetical protein
MISFAENMFNPLSSNDHFSDSPLELENANEHFSDSRTKGLNIKSWKKLCQFQNRVQPFNFGLKEQTYNKYCCHTA